MSEASFKNFVLRVDEGIGWLEYNRPPVNAFDWQMLRETPAALRRLIDDPAVRVLVIASAIERHFNAGADLQVLREVRGEQMREWVRICHDGIVAALRSSPKPLLAAINGTAVGGGLEIAWHCDLRFAAADARIGQPEINIAFLPPIAATQALARLVGTAKALRFLYEGRLLAASEALEWGLVDFLVEPDRLREEVRRYALLLAQRPANALASIRRCIVEGGALEFAQGMSIELEEAVKLSDSPNYAEGIRAFLDKRPPRWR